MSWFWSRPLGLVGISVASIVLAAGSDASPSAGSAQVAEQTAARQGILVELFTSQGCSSCPPADRLLSELAARDDIDVIPLSFHVDYWNYIGWTDPFSSPAWSKRQRRYAEALEGNRIYTPQMVVDGHLEAVGSRRSSILGLLDRARSGKERIEIDLSAAFDSNDAVRVEAGVAESSRALGSKPLELWVAVIESELTTPVGRGENASKTLRNDRVVRCLERIPERDSAVRIALEEEWRRERLSVAAFLQDMKTLRVYGAAEVGLAR